MPALPPRPITNFLFSLIITSRSYISEVSKLTACNGKQINKQICFSFCPFMGLGYFIQNCCSQLHLFTHRFHKYLRQEIIQFSLEKLSKSGVLKMRKPKPRWEKDFQIFHSGNGILKTWVKLAEIMPLIVLKSRDQLLALVLIQKLQSYKKSYILNPGSKILAILCIMIGLNC